MCSHETEVWKPVVGWEQSFLVSNLGRVFSLPDGVHMGHVMNGAISHYGYVTVNLRRGDKRESALVHRLVAEAFLPNTDGLGEINHIDCDKTNNAAYNLEWCDRQSNMDHAKEHALLNPRLKPVIRSDGKRFKSVKSAAAALGVSPTAVSHSINDGISVHGYFFSADEVGEDE